MTELRSKNGKSRPEPEETTVRWYDENEEGDEQDGEAGRR